MYIERTNYYARPGRAAEVLAIRREASELRVRLGLPAGTIYVADIAGAGCPDVAWECTYPSFKAYEQDLAVRDATPEFNAVRARMHEATVRFERHLMRPATPSGSTVTAYLDLAGLTIAPRPLTFRSGEYDLAGYLFLPPGEGPFPCMIVNHGSGIDKGTWDVCRPGVATILMSWGTAAFMFHRHGYGDSPGPGWREEVTAEFGTDAYDEQLVARLDREGDDVLAALDFVSGLLEIDRDHIGVMGSSFGGINTLLAAARSDRFRCAVEFAGAAMNWDRTPRLRAFLSDAARRVKRPIFFIQAANDYSVGPTQVLPGEAAAAGAIVESKIYPAFGITAMEGHLLFSSGSIIWGADVQRFLAQWL